MAFIEQPGVEGPFHNGTSEDHLVSHFKGSLGDIIKYPVHLEDLSHVTVEVVLMIDCLH